MDGSTLAIVLSVIGCFSGTSGVVSYRLYCNNQEEQVNPTQLRQTINTSSTPVIQRQPSPVIDHAIKKVLDGMRDSKDSEAEIDIKIHIQSHKEKE